jgi:hypothetical protein
MRIWLRRSREQMLSMLLTIQLLILFVMLPAAGRFVLRISEVWYFGIPK